MSIRHVSFNDAGTSVWSDDLILYREVCEKLGTRFNHYVVFKKKIYCFKNSFAELYVFSPFDLENIESVRRCLGITPLHHEKVCVTFDGKSRILVVDETSKTFSKISIEGKKWKTLELKLPETISEIQFGSVFGGRYLYLFSRNSIDRILIRKLLVPQSESETSFERCNSTCEEIIRKVTGVTQIHDDLVFLMNQFVPEKQMRKVKHIIEETEGENEVQTTVEEKNKNSIPNIFLFGTKDGNIHPYDNPLRSTEDILNFTNEEEFKMKKDWIGALCDQEFIEYIEYALKIKQSRRKIQELKDQESPFKLKPLKLKKPKIIFLKFIENLIRTMPLYVLEHQKALKKQEEEEEAQESKNSSSSWVWSMFKTKEEPIKKKKEKERIHQAFEVIQDYPVFVDHFERSFGKLEKEYKVNEYLKAVFMFFLFSNKSSYYSNPNPTIGPPSSVRFTGKNHEYGLIYELLTIENSVEEAIETIVKSRRYEDLPPNYRNVYARFSRELFASDLATNFGYDQIINDKSYLSYFKIYKTAMTIVKPFFTKFNPTGYIEYLLKFFGFSRIGIRFIEGACHLSKTKEEVSEVSKRLSTNGNSLFPEFKKKFIHQQSIFEWRKIQKFSRLELGNSKFEINYDRFLVLLKRNIPRVKNGEYEKKEVEELIEYFQKIHHLREIKLMMNELKKKENQRQFYEILDTLVPWLNEVYRLCNVTHVVNSWLNTVGRLIEIIEEENRYLEKAKKNLELLDSEEERHRLLEIELHSMFDSFTKELYKAFKELFENDVNSNNIIRNTTRWCKSVRELVTRNGNIQFHSIYFLEEDQKRAMKVILDEIEKAFSLLNAEKDELEYELIAPKDL